MPITEAELVRYIDAAGEENNIDAKGPMAWDGAEVSASLAKDIAALANSRDGGVLVIGKSEIDKKFVCHGLTKEQASSFDTTKMANWVNSRFRPPINFSAYQVPYDGKDFVVVTVSEFDDIPTVCEKQFEPHLKRGAIYVRSDTASSPVTSSDELRMLIGLATTKRANEFVELLEAVTKGRPLLPLQPEIDPYEAERQEVLDDIRANAGDAIEKGAWAFVIQPVIHKARWDTPQQLKEIVSACAVRLGREFPHVGHDPRNFMWGFLSRHYEDVCGFTLTGLFEAVRLFRENTFPYKSTWSGHSGFEPGTWLEWRLSLTYFVDFFLFASRLVEHFDVGEEFEVEVTCGPFRGRRLAAIGGTSDPSEPVAASSYKFKKRLTAEDLRGSWKEMCVREAHRFVSLFFSEQVSPRTVQDWIESIVNRK